MDTIVRFWWICWDNLDGTEEEEIFHNMEKAFEFFRSLNRAPYKKITACYNDHDETICTVTTTF